MAVHNHNQDLPDDLPPSSDVGGQWVLFEHVDDRKPQFNSMNLSSVQLAGTTADDVDDDDNDAIVAQMDRMDIDDVNSDFELEDDYDMSHYAGSNNSGATGNTVGVETDRFRDAPAIQGARAPGRQRLTAAVLEMHSRQLSQHYSYADTPGGWVTRPAFWGPSHARSKFSKGYKTPKGSTTRKIRKSPTSIAISDASSAWAPVIEQSGIANDVAGAGDWAADIAAPPRGRH